MQNIRVLITGASGLIGLNLMKHFNNLSDGSTSYEVHGLSIRDIPQVCLSEFVGKNVILHKKFDSVLGSFDMIFNCSGPSQPAIFTQNPNLVIDANIIQISKLHALLSPSGRFIQMSSSEIYSGCKKKPCTETHLGDLDASNPRRLYVRSKELAEILLENYRTKNQLILIARVSLVYGPGTLLGDRRVLFEFVQKALTGLLVIEGATHTIRRYLYVEDFLSMLDLVLRQDRSGFEIFNFGGDEEVKIAELAGLIATLTKAELQNNYVNDNRTAGAPDEVWVSLEKFRSLAPGFEVTKLEQGLIPTIKWTADLMKSAGQL